MPAKNIVQSSLPSHSDTMRHQTKLQPHKQDDPTGYAAVSESLSFSNTPLLSHSASIVLYLAYNLSQFAAERMDADGGREGGEGK